MRQLVFDPEQSITRQPCFLNSTPRQLLEGPQVLLSFLPETLSYGVHNLHPSRLVWSTTFPIRNSIYLCFIAADLLFQFMGALYYPPHVCVGGYRVCLPWDLAWGLMI